MMPSFSGVVCALCFVLAVSVFAAESDFVCAVVNSSGVVCSDCKNFCTGCGIKCDANGNIASL